MTEGNSICDFVDEIKIKFDQNIIFPLHVRYERVKRMIQRYIQLHPMMAEWVEIVSFVLCCMLISYLMSRLQDRCSISREKYINQL